MNYNEIIIKKNKIKYRDEGKGIPILLLPDFTGNDTIWDNIIDDLSYNHRVITLDFSEASVKPNNIIDIIDNFALSINLDYFFIVGYSIGALIALKYANNHPEKIFGVAVSSLGHISKSEKERIKYYIKDFKTETNFWKRFINILFKKENNDFPSNFSYILKFNTIKQELDSLPHPLLIINGENDHLTCQKTASYIYKHKDNAKFEIIEKADKDCFNTNFNLYNELLTDFIKNIKL